MTTITKYLNTRARRQVALVAGVLLLLLATCGPWRGAGQREIADLPPVVIASLSQPPVWCYAEFSDGRMESTITGYSPNLTLDEALTQYGYQYWTEADIAQQHLYCYTSWQAAFAYQERRQASGDRGARIATLQKEMPATPNEADYQVAVLYSLFNKHWRAALDIAYSPSVSPHTWFLTEPSETTLRPDN